MEVLIEVECRVSDRTLGENPQGEQRNVLTDRVSPEAVSARERVPVPELFGDGKAGRAVKRSRQRLESSLGSTGIRWFQLESFHHERDQSVPAVKAQIAGQRPQIVKEDLAGQKLTDALVVGIEQLEQGVKKECQEIERRQ